MSDAPPRRAGPRARSPSSRPTDAQKRSPAQRPTIGLRGLIWMTAAGADLGGPGRVSLLREIRDKGTIAHAARAMGMSYKAAWDAIDLMNQLAGEPLVTRSAGGRGGGSTRLTARGEQLIERFDEVDRVHHRFVEALNVASDGLREPLAALGDFGFRPGIRNLLRGTVAAVQSGAGADVVELALVHGGSIFAETPPGGLAQLGLHAGSAAVASFSASSVILAPGRVLPPLSARNRLAGRVERLLPGAQQGCEEVVLALGGGSELVASIDAKAVERLGLAPGARAVAIFDTAGVRLRRAGP